MIYLDSCSTTNVTPEVLDAMLPYFIEHYGNPSSLYKFGRESKNAIEHAREQIAKAINAEPEQIIFTSGASESNSWIMNRYKPVLCSPYEHHSISGQRNVVSYADIDILAEKMRFYKPPLVSHIIVGNETGEIYDVKELCKIAHTYDFQPCLH